MACIILPLALFLGLAVGAVILRAACHLAGQSVPGFGLAMGIVFITGVIQAILGSVINFAFGIPLIQDPGQQPVDTSTALAAGIVGFLINTPVTMILYRVMIPTDHFGKAALVWLMQLLIVIGIVIVFGVLVFVVGLAIGGF